MPNFTAIRCYDRFHDIIELKQPFLKLFRQGGDFGSVFNDSWNQAEGYLSFAIRQRSYLKEEKGLEFENPRCVLLMGYNLSELEIRNIREKESMSRTVTVLTYNHLLKTAQHLLH
ncbi:MAG: Shedu anti-phage system protein SduA domain-containing protein, partial [bacterium]